MGFKKCYLESIWWLQSIFFLEYIVNVYGLL